MTHTILVVSPHTAFGELIRQSLVKSSADYVVAACLSAEEALALCQVTAFAVIILDGELTDMPLINLGQKLQALCPGTRLVAFPPGNNPRDPAIAGLKVQAYLKKPFYLPSLKKTIARLLTTPLHPEEAGIQAALKLRKHKKKSQLLADPPVEASIPDARFADLSFTAGPEEEEPIEAEPTLDPAEIEQVRQSWFDESITIAGEEKAGSTKPLVFYTCVLIPLQPDQYLRFDLAAALERWMRQVSETEKWRLDRLSIRPSHLEWTVGLPGEISPDEMLKTYRRYTSECLFMQFPAFTANHPSGDFWAPENLLNPGERSLTRQEIYAFVAAAHPPSLHSPTFP